MRIEDRFHNRLNELIDVGHLVLRTRSAPPVLLDADDIVDSELAMLWATDSQSLLLMIFGETNAHYKNFVKCMDGSIGYSDALQAQRVLITAAKELDSGCLVAARKLIEAEILGDFMSQTERLIADGYFQAAAVVAGSVLENSVRILCNRNSIQLSKRPKLGKMIDDLAKTGIYTELQM